MTRSLRKPLLSRAGLLAALLVASFLLVVPIVYEAWRTAKSHEVFARRALREYARFATQQFTRHLEAVLYVSLSRRLGEARGLDGTDEAAAVTAADLQQASAHLAACRCQFLNPTRLYFALPVEGGSPETAPAGLLDRQRASWLADTLRAHLRADSLSDPAFRILHAANAGPELELIVYTMLRDARGRPTRIVGLAGDAASFMAPAVERVLARDTLLPASLVRPGLAGSRFTLTLGAPAGSVYHTTGGGHRSSFAARAALDGMFGGGFVAITLAPALESAAYFGGSPSAKLGFLMLALAIAAGLAGVALLLLRREHEFVRHRAHFTSSVSHELRTPLAQILLCGETLRDGRARSAEERRWATNVIVREARRLITMVENVLHVARAERQMVAVSPEWLELGPAVEEVLRDFAPLAEARRVRWRTDIADDVVAHVDRFALRQVLLNLLDNAVKYGPPGQEIVVRLRLDGRRAWLAVEDQGPGLPAAERGTIWQPFRRGRATAELHQAGVGLGLAVVRELTAAHGGEAWVEDAGTGSRFVVTFPRVFDAGHPEGRPESAEARPSSSDALVPRAI